MKGFETLCVTDSFDNSGPVTPHLQPIYAGSTFIYPGAQKAMEVFQGKESAFIYSRWDNPSYRLVEQKVAALETYGSNLQAEGLLFASGMAAISSVLLSFGLGKGDTIITQGNLYGTTTEMLNVIMAQTGVNIIYTDFADLAALEAYIKADSSIKLMYIETPANPTLACYDLAALAKLAKAHDILTVCDNTFATPYLQRPLTLGIDYVAHSTTKFLNGHGTATGGLVISTHKEHMQRKVWQMRKLLGGNASAFDAFLLNNGIKTLVLRMDKHQTNAQQVAEFLEGHPAIDKVNYPGLPSHEDHALAKKQMDGFGSVISFELKGGLQAGIDLMDRVKLCILTATLGTTDTLLQHPASMTHVQVPKAQREQFGITDGLIRLSVGLENVEDIIADLQQALA